MTTSISSKAKNVNRPINHVNFILDVNWYMISSQKTSTIYIKQEVRKSLFQQNITGIQTDIMNYRVSLH